MIFALLFCLSQFLVAQTRFDFIIGTTISSFDKDLMSDYEFDTRRDEYINAGGSATSEVTNSVRTGFYLAAEADFFVSETSFVKTGIKYTTTGDSYFFKTDDVVLQSSSGSKSDEKFKLRPRLDYLAIPINFGLKASDKISVYAGVTPHMALSNTLRNNRFEGGSNDDLKQKWDKTDKPINEATIVTFLNGGINYIFEEEA